MFLSHARRGAFFLLLPFFLHDQREKLPFHSACERGDEERGLRPLVSALTDGLYCFMAGSRRAEIGNGLCRQGLFGQCKLRAFL